MVNKYRNINKNLKTLFLLLMLFTMSSLVSSASLSSFKPSFDSIESTIVRKEVFFNYLLPAIHKKNAEIGFLKRSSVTASFGVILPSVTLNTCSHMGISI